MKLKPILCLSALLAFGAQPSLAQETDAEKASRFLVRLVNQYSILILRSTVDLTYESLSISPKTLDVVITGLEVYPDFDWDGAGACVITIDRVSSSALYSFERSESLIEVNGLFVPRECFTPEVGGPMVGFGYDGIRSDSMSVQLSYDLPTSAATMALSTTLDDALDLSVTADFDYFWFRLPLDGAGDEPEPAIRLGAAEITVENRGLWEKVEPMLGAQLGDLSIAPQMIEGIVLQSLSGPNGEAAGPEAAAFASNLGAEIGRFLDEKNRLVVATDLEQGVWLDEDLFDDPQAMIAAFNPQVSAVPAAVRSLVDPDVLAATLSDPAILEHGARLRIGEALLTGVGAPRSIADGLAVLAPLAESWDGQASALSAEVLAAQGDTAEAYRMALQAMAAGETLGITIADRLEAEMAVPDILALQDAAARDWPGAESRLSADQALIAEGDLGGIRSLAYAAALGDQIPRSYAAAYYWASLAAAGGDRGAATLRDRLDARFGTGEGRAAWQAMTAEAGSAAFQIWTEGGLAATIRQVFGAE